MKGLVGWLLPCCFILENHPAVCSLSTHKRGEVDFPLTQAGGPPQTGERLNTHYFFVKMLQIYKKQKNPWSASAIAGNLMHGA